MTVGALPSDASPNPPPKPGSEATAKPEGQHSEQDSKNSDAKLRDEYLAMLANGSPIYHETQSSTCPISSSDCVLTNVSIDGNAQAPFDMDTFKAKLAGANDFIGQANGGKPGDQAALQDWLFQSKDGATKADFKSGTLDVATKAADGTDVSAKITRDIASIKAGDATITHYRNNGDNVYESAAYEAIDKGDLRIIKDKASGYTVQYDVKTHEGKVFRKDGELAMQFSSMKDLQAEVTHRLSDQKYMTQLVGKERLETEARAYLKALKPGDPNAPKERGFVDGQGDFIIVTRAGLMYQTDKANHSVYLEQNGQRVRITNGIAYNDDISNGTSTEIHDFKRMGAVSMRNGVVYIAGKEAVLQNGQVSTADGTKIETSKGTLTTAGDGGLVTVQSGNGSSTVTNPHVATLTLDATGKATNSLKETQGAFSSFSAQSGFEGHAASGASYNFGAKNDEIQVREASGQVTDIGDNGTVRSVDRNGDELARVDENGDITLGGRFKIGHGGGVSDDGTACGKVDGGVRDTAVVEFNTALGDIDLALGNLSGVDLNGLESRLGNDVANMSQLAAFATSLGPQFTWAANILIAKSEMAQAAFSRVKALAAQQASRATPGTTNGRSENGANPAPQNLGSENLAAQEGNRLLRGSVNQTDLLSSGLLLDQGSVVPTSFSTSDAGLTTSADAPLVQAAPDLLTLPNNTDVPLATTPTDSAVVASVHDDQVVVAPAPPSDATTLLASALPTGAPNEQFLQSGFLPKSVDDGTPRPAESALLDGGTGVEENLALPNRANRVDPANGMLASITPRVEPISGVIAPPLAPEAPVVPVGSPLERLAANQPSSEDVASAIGAVVPLFNAHRAKQPQQLPLPSLGFEPIEGGLDEASIGTPPAAKPLRRVEPLAGQVASTRNAPSRLDQRDGLGMPSNRTNIFQSGMLSVPPLET